MPRMQPLMDSKGLKDFIGYAHAQYAEGAVKEEITEQGWNVGKVVHDNWAWVDTYRTDRAKSRYGGQIVVSKCAIPVWTENYYARVLSGEPDDFLDFYVKRVLASPHSELPVCGTQNLEANGLRYMFSEEDARERAGGNLSVGEFNVTERVVAIPSGELVYRGHLQGGWLIDGGLVEVR